MQGFDKIKESGVQFIWQTGKIYINEAQQAVKAYGELPMLHVTDFISDMAAAYSAADVVISRAGAGSISEFCLLGKPVILVPSPNVAEDHQTKMHWHLSTRMRHFTLKIAKQLKNCWILPSKRFTNPIY